jgi:hypothetical protein
MNPAGANAHRSGWSLHRIDSIASNGHPRAKPSSTAPVTAFSRIPTNGAATKLAAATNRRSTSRQRSGE